jgi:nitroreductase
MEFRDILAKRRMHREYVPEPIPPESIERIVSTIRRAPSGGFSQGASVVVVTDPELRAAIVGARRADLPPDYQGGRDWMADAPVFLVICTNEEHYHRRYQEADKLAVGGGREIRWPVPYWFVDAGAYMMLVLLAAIDEGLAAAFWGFPSQEARLREMLALPEEVVPIGVASIGKPAPDPSQERASAAFRKRRRPDDEVIHWERWGASRP